MIGDLWGAFPQLIEQNINSLLDRAEPNRIKAFMLYKACQNDGLWSDDFDGFKAQLESFYAKPRAARRKSDFAPPGDANSEPVIHGETNCFAFEVRAFFTRASMDDG